MLKCYLTRLLAESFRSSRYLIALLALLVVTLVWADHGAPPARLGGVRLCVAPPSIQVSLEGVPWADEAGSGEIDSAETEARIRTAVLSSLTRSLTAAEIPYTTTCTGSGGVVVITLDLRYLDPETYLGFPENAYTYVSAAQVGTLERGAGVTSEPTLSEGRYSASASDIIQAAGETELEAQALALGEAQVTALVRAWLEANRIAARSYLLFAGLGGALLALRVLVTVLR